MLHHCFSACELFIEVLSQTDLAKQLVVMLGYEEISQVTLIGSHAVSVHSCQFV